MKAVFTLNNITKISELPDYWSKDDYFKLLELFDIPVANTLSEAECIEYLQMAVSDLEPNEAAQTILTYKLSDSLNANQIEQVSNEMLLDKIAEEYPVIDLHRDLFSINQLLYKLYNGKFPNTDALCIEITAKIDAYDEVLSKEELLKNTAKMLSDSNLIKRLFGEKLESEESFEEANGIIWKMENDGENYKFYTSEYWISQQDFALSEIETNFEKIEVAED